MIENLIVFRGGIVATFVFSIALLPGAAAQSDDPIANTVEAAVKGLAAKQPFVGLSIAVVENDQIVYSHGWGWADLENHVPATSNTVYRTASVAKPLTATAAMILASRGRLDLDAPVQRYCPTYPAKQWSVTTRELLGHLGGVRHYRSDAPTDPEILSTTHYASATDAVRMFAADPLLHEPGTRFLYSTFGYVLVGCVLEGVTHEMFPQVLNELVLTPAGMLFTRADDVSQIIERRARPYSKTAAGEIINAPLSDLSDKVPAGGLVSTAPDLAAFAIALDSGKLLTFTQRDMMWTPQKNRTGESNGYALGWGTFNKDGNFFVGHGGDQPGASAALYILPKQHLAVALMSNLDDVNLDDLAEELLTTLSAALVR